MLIALTNRTPEPTPKARDPRVSFDRYFRQGRHQRQQPPPKVDVFALFRTDPPSQISVPAKKVLAFKPDTTLAVHVPEVPEVPLGIDLAVRGIEIRKIFYAGFRARVVRMGYDPEDVLQELYHGLLIRNKGKCPFDPSKSSFTHYVHMVAGCLLSNYRRRYSRLERNEVFGVRAISITDDPNALVDVAQADIEWVEPVQEDLCVMDSITTSLTKKAVGLALKEGRDPTLVEKCLEYLLLGMKQKEIAAALECAASVVSDTVKFIRRVSAEWRDTELQVC